MYAIWLRVDSETPWIELKGEYETKRDAKRAIEEFVSKVQTKIVTIPERQKFAQIKAIALIRSKR